MVGGKGTVDGLLVGHRGGALVWDDPACGMCLGRGLLGRDCGPDVEVRMYTAKRTHVGGVVRGS